MDEAEMTAARTDDISASRQPDLSLGALRRTWRDDRWVRPFFTRYGRVMVLAIVLGLLSFICAGAVMFVAGYTISLAAAVPITMLVLVGPIILMTVFGVGQPVLNFYERITSHDWMLRVTSELRRLLYRAFDHMLPNSETNVGLGRAHALLADDIGHVQNLYVRCVFPLITSWMLTVIIVIAMGIFSLPMAAILLILLVIETVVMPLISVCVNGARMLRQRQAHAQLYESLTDDVLGVEDWILSGRREYYLSRHHRLADDVRSYEKAINRSDRIVSLIVQAIFGLCIVALIVWAGLAFSAHAAGTQTTAVMAIDAAAAEVSVDGLPLWIAAFVFCFFPLLEAFTPATGAMEGFVTHSEAISHLNALPDPYEGDAEPDQSASASTAAAPTSAAAAPASTAAKPVSRDISEHLFGNGAAASAIPPIMLEDVSVRYHEGSHDVLHDINIFIPGGQKVAVLGRSGAGKSTLALLLRGELAPREGTVRIGSADAVSQQISQTPLVGVIPQFPHLFNQTLRDNLLIGREDATDEELVSVMEAVGLGELLRRLPEGLDTVIDEGGRRFSGGERHRIALARVLLARTNIVILDEPFTGLDPATEAALLTTMLDTLADKTVILITHHLQGIDQMDRVIFIEDGSVFLDGAPNELEQQSSRYRQLLAFERGVKAL